VKSKWFNFVQQSPCNDRRIVPAHTYRTRENDSEVFPDAKFIHIVRNPLKILSTVTMEIAESRQGFQPRRRRMDRATCSITCANVRMF
jgi:hypothetical protein